MEWEREGHQPLDTVVGLAGLGAPWWGQHVCHQSTQGGAPKGLHGDKTSAPYEDTGLGDSVSERTPDIGEAVWGSGQRQAAHHAQLSAAV